MRSLARFIMLIAFRTAYAVLGSMLMTLWTLAIFKLAHIEALTFGTININLMMKKKNIDKPSHVLKCIAMTSPKNAPTKCRAK